MKIRKNILGFMLIAATAFSIQSCSKDNGASTTTSVDDSASQSQQSNDEATTTNESESSLTDANTAMGSSSFSKTSSIPGATIDSIVVDKKMIINYNGNCADGSRYRTGQITVQLTSGAHWRDANAVLTVTFNNYKVKRNATGKTIIINGTHVITNVSGGLANALTVGTSVTHRITGSMVITFDDGTQRTWQVTRQRIIGLTIGNSAYVSISGFGTYNASTNVLVSGTNRAGNAFYTIVNTAIVYSSACSWTATSGVEVHKGIAREITVTFGVDASGNAVSANCPYGYKINWINASGTAKVAVINY